MPSQIYLRLKNPAFYVTYYMKYKSILHKPCLNDYKTLHVICFILPTVHNAQIPTYNIPTFNQLYTT